MTLTFTGRQGDLSLLVGRWWTEGACKLWSHGFGCQLHHDGAALGVDHHRLFRLLVEGLGHTSQERTATHYHIHYQRCWWLSRRLKEKGEVRVKFHDLHKNLFGRLLQYTQKTQRTFLYFYSECNQSVQTTSVRRFLDISCQDYQNPAQIIGYLL